MNMLILLFQSYYTENFSNYASSLALSG